MRRSWTAVGPIASWPSLGMRLKCRESVPSGIITQMPIVTPNAPAGDRSRHKRRGPRMVAAKPIKPVTADKITQTRRNIREPTKAGERKIHEVV
jgi:hypothetical protein